ncbi:MAG: hypothetical protein WC637_02215 [Victivallales bacterium]|jgi:hypothetical protein
MSATGSAVGQLKELKMMKVDEDADNVFQFRFSGPAILRVEITSWPIRPGDGQGMLHLTPIGPPALFLD